MDITKTLICTDYDGTLSFEGIPKENLDAIERFMAAGGLFSLSTGRRGEEMLKRDVLPFVPNAPMVALTGSQIYDVKNQAEIYHEFMDESWRELMEKLLYEYKDMRFFQIVCPEGPIDVTLPNEGALHAIKSATQVYKIVVIHEKSENPIPESIKSLCKEFPFEVTSNGHSSFELTARGVSKGSAVKRLKAIVGAEKLICVGDFYGDISMIKEADVGIAVGNAIDELKRVADVVTVHAKDGAIAKIIDGLMANQPAP